MAVRQLSLAKSMAQSRGNLQMAVVGDSRTDQSTVPSIATPSATEYSKMAQGYVSWLQFLTGQRFEFNIADNYGKSGDTTALMLARVPAIIAASQAKAAIILIGTNDANAGVPFATSQANMEAMITLFQAAGWTLFIFAELPRGDGTNTAQRLSATNLKLFLQWVDYLRNLRTRPGIFVADSWPFMADPLSTTGDVASVDRTKDGLHQAPTGAYWMTQPMVPLINAVYPAIGLLPSTNSDQYDATSNPKGCLNTNPMMGGTGGSFNATGGSGTVVDGWSENAGPTWTRVYAVSTLANGKAAQQVTIGGTGTTTSVSLRQVITAGNLTIGDRVQAVASVEFGASMANISQFALQILDNNTITAGDFRRSVSTEVLPTVAAMAGIMRTPVYTLTSTTVQLQFNMLVINAVTPAAVIKFGQVALRKV